MLTIFGKFYHTSDVLNTLSQIKASDLVKYSNDISFINEMITSISRSREIQLSRGKLKYLKDIIFKYDPTIMEMFTSIDVARDDINWAQGQIRRFEATEVYRYRGVDAYKGVAGERVISRYLMNIFPSIVLNTPIGEGNAIDEFDFRLNELTCDIKCSTQLHYASITPKVAVENGTPKDYYIGARFDEVIVYAKLPRGPRGFYIPTPVGNYSPDWAISFKKGSVKHIFFIAETKGTMDSLELRPIEQAKITCAKKLFNEISTSGVKYHDVDSYQSLLEVMETL
jgi:restriction endonuclease